MSNEPALGLLDVDGVLNACPYMPGMVQYDWNFDVDVNVGPFPMHMSTEMAAALLSLPMDLEWLTTWCMRPDNNDANERIAPLLGLPRLPQHRALPRRFSQCSWWKRDVFDSLRERFPTRKIVWMDDDLSAEMGLKRGSTHITPDGLTLMVCPEPDVGLTKAHIETIREFLTKETK